MWWIEIKSHRNMQATPGIHFLKGIRDYAYVNKLKQVV